MMLPKAHLTFAVQEVTLSGSKIIVDKVVKEGNFDKPLIRMYIGIGTKKKSGWLYVRDHTFVVIWVLRSFLCSSVYSCHRI